MAKIKVSELAAELGCESKELIAFLQESGIEAKRSNSSIEEVDAERARKRFVTSPSRREKEGSVKTKQDHKEELMEQKKEKEVQPEKVATPSGAKENATAPQKKKKKIIFVSNPNNSKFGGAHPTQQTENGKKRGTAGKSGFAVSQNAYRPIKPLTKPKQLEEYGNSLRKPLSPAPKSTTKNSEQNQNEMPLSPTQNNVEVVEKVKNGASPENREQSQPKKNNKPFSERNGKGGAAPGAKDSQGRGQKDAQGRNLKEGSRSGAGKNPRLDAPRDNAPAKQANGKNAKGDHHAKTERNFENRRGENEKRRPTQEKERKGTKNLVNLYQGEEQMSRSKKAGRFIKPEVEKTEEPKEQIKVISVPDKLTIKEFADKMHIQPSAIIKKLFLAGQIMTVNSELSYEEAENIAIDYDIICEKEEPVDVIEELLKEDEDEESTLEKRPPVVVVMGHVDHGKTSLLDAIRKTDVIGKEAGGITQKIGAYSVNIKDRCITFLDTPGHEAFTAMRMRGANSTDIAVLVVAADDGVMPQTIEAINHAKAAGVEIIVAVNKIDKPSANVDRVKQELTEQGLIATDWGGSTEFVPVSAKTGEGLETLLETILLTADIMELKANPHRQARGLVLEAELDKGKGPVANVLIQKGTLHVGDFISAGANYGRVRAMVNDKGKRVKEATPSMPVEILGLSDVPFAGEILVGHESDREAKQYAQTYSNQHKSDLIEETKARMSLDDLYSKIEEGKLKELNIILKADVQGSVEALRSSLLKLSGEEVVVKVIHSGVGAINESDVSLAATSNAIIIGFDVKPDAMAKSIAEHEGVEIKIYRVIYQAIDDVEAAMKGMLAPIYEEKVIGHAEVRQIFKASAIGNIAGSFVLDGKLERGCKVRIRRAEELIFEGELKSLKRFKDDAKEVKEGFECGLVFDGFDQMQVGDVVEAYVMVEVPRK